MDTVIQNLENAINNFLNETQNATGWEIKPTANKWSAKEIIGHLTDSAQINLQRFIRCTYEDGFKLIYFQDEWVAAAHYQEAELNDLLQLWQLLNRQIMRVWQYYPADRWQVKCDNSRAGITLLTVEFLAKDYVEHLEHHLQQVRALLRK